MEQIEKEKEKEKEKEEEEGQKSTSTTKYENAVASICVALSKQLLRSIFRWPHKWAVRKW